jgi:hypothetical protein
MYQAGEPLPNNFRLMHRFLSQIARILQLCHIRVLLASTVFPETARPRTTRGKAWVVFGSASVFRANSAGLPHRLG